MTPLRRLSGQAYLDFLRDYLNVFKPTRRREKILGPFFFDSENLYSIKLMNFKLTDQFVYRF
jgi:hypothetical protein